MLILTPVPRHKKIKASRGMDVPRKAAFYSALDEWDMNRAWQLAEHWQADGPASRLTGRLAGR